MSWFENVFAEEIWKTKYAGKYGNVRKYFKDLVEIISLNDNNSKKKFFELLWEKRFIPAGRILAFGGRPEAFVSLMNCTTHAVQGDSLEDINAAAYAIMRASSRGQGIGIDISKLRPKDAPVNNAARTSTGAISFMEMLAAVAKTIGQEGRRAALLFSIMVDHPDLWRPYKEDVPCARCEGKGCLNCEGTGFIPFDFLNVKTLPYRVENANISVMITDKFMFDVISDKPWGAYFEGVSGNNEFSYHTGTAVVSAKEVFRKIAESAWKSAEPGLLMWDTAKRMSNSDLFGFPITGVNACSEQVLDQEGVCNLGSMNLFSYVSSPFTENASFNYEKFSRDVGSAIHFLDNVLEVELVHGHPISGAQRNAIKELRRVGLGVMGLADVIAALGYSYGDADSLKITETIFEVLRNSSYEKSIELAKEFGSAPVWMDKTTEEREEIVNYGFFSTLPSWIKEEIVEHGTRNVSLLSVAPTGSISNLIGVTSGIEPLFAERYTRRVKMNGEDEFIDYVHPGVVMAEGLGVEDAYTTAYSVTPQEHVWLQVVAQKYVDQAISKTVNMPKESTVEDIEDIYTLAWEQGIKGITVYRDGSRDEQILYVDSDPKEACPSCGNGLEFKEGCKECPSCGWSACTM
jgi:ribonucleoside-diphosphate reductase alpha chain